MEPIEHIIEFLVQTDELDAANKLLDVFAKYSNSLQQYDLLGKLYHDVKNYKNAVAFAERTLALSQTPEQSYSARSNLAKLYNHTNQPDKALMYLNINAEFTNEYNSEILLEKVFSLFLLNRKQESEAILRQMLENSHLYDERVNNRVKFNLGTYDLYAGRFQEGLRGFLLVGKELGIWKKLNLDASNYWDGEIIPNKQLILFAEGGIGDEIINIRFFNKIKELGMNPVWYTFRKDVAEIFNRNGYTTINDLSNVDTTNALWTYSMSLPIYLNETPDSLWVGPYLTANKQTDFNLGSNIRIGIRWTGNPRYEQDLHRGIPLKQLYDTVKSTAPNATIYSIQRDEGVEQLDSFEHDIIDLSDKLQSWEDTLNILDQLDVVITSCTSVAHASSALGKITYIIVPITAYYTWASTTDTTSIWYGDSTKILRQVNPKKWDEPMTQLKDELSTIIES